MKFGYVYVRAFVSFAFSLPEQNCAKCRIETETINARYSVYSLLNSRDKTDNLVLVLLHHSDLIADTSGGQFAQH